MANPVPMKKWNLIWTPEWRIFATVEASTARAAPDKDAVPQVHGRDRRRGGYMSHDEAIEEFKKLVSQYGLKWTSKVPAEAWTKMNEIVAVTSEDDRRRAAVSEIYRRD